MIACRSNRLLDSRSQYDIRIKVFIHTVLQMCTHLLVVRMQPDCCASLDSHRNTSYIEDDSAGKY
jgi:hypothetical protein